MIIQLPDQARRTQTCSWRWQKRLYIPEDGDSPLTVMAADTHPDTVTPGLRYTFLRRCPSCYLFPKPC